MENKTGKIRILLCAVILAVPLIIFLVVYHLPRTLQWTGWAETAPDSIGTSAELSVDLRMYPKLFGEPSITGSVIVNGKRYVDTVEFGPLPNWYMGGYYQPFVPDTRIQGKSLDLRRVVDDYLIVFREGAYIRIVAYHKQEKPFGFIIDGSYSFFVGGIHIGGTA